MRSALLFVFVACLLCATATESKADELPDTPAPPAPASAGPSVQPLVSVLYQSDPRWAHARLGRSTIGRQGCLDTVMAMIIGKDPRQARDLLLRYGLLTARGQLVWDFPEGFPIAIVNRIMLGRDDAVARVRENLQQGMFVLLQLKHSASGRRGQHWVLGLAETGDDILVIDPVHGPGTLRDLYGRIAVREMVVVKPNG